MTKMMFCFRGPALRKVHIEEAAYTRFSKSLVSLISFLRSLSRITSSATNATARWLSDFFVECVLGLLILLVRGCCYHFVVILVEDNCYQFLTFFVVSSLLLFGTTLVIYLIERVIKLTRKMLQHIQ